MKERTENRKVQYTKKVIKDSLRELLEKKQLSKISVKEICELADINRRSFYYHYEDIYDLVHKIEEEAAKKIISEIKIFFKDNKSLSIQQEIFNSVFLIYKDDEVSFWLLDEKSTGYGLSLFLKNRFEDITNRFVHAGLDRKEAEYLQIYCQSGYVGLLQYWYRNGFQTDDTIVQSVLLNQTTLLLQAIEEKRYRKVAEFPPKDIKN